MSAVETGQMSAVETRQMSSAETRQMSTGKTGRCPVSLFYICLASSATSPVIFIRLKIMCSTTTGKTLELRWSSSCDYWNSVQHSHFCSSVVIADHLLKTFKARLNSIHAEKSLDIIQTKIHRNLKFFWRRRKLSEIIESHLLVVFFKPVNCPLSSWNDEFKSWFIFLF